MLREGAVGSNSIRPRTLVVTLFLDFRRSGLIAERQIV